MQIQINSIITLENQIRYVVLNETNLDGKKYFLVMEVDEKKEVVPTNVAILEEVVDGTDIYITKITDSNLIIKLTQMLKAQI